MKTFFIFALFLLLLDVPFINFIIKPMYNSMGFAQNTNVMYALCAYIFMTLSWYFIKSDILKAGLIGLIIFGTYVFTLLAVIPNYNLKTGLMELTWGPILFMLATFLTNKMNF